MPTRLAFRHTPREFRNRHSSRVGKNRAAGFVGWADKEVVEDRVVVAAIVAAVDRAAAADKVAEAGMEGRVDLLAVDKWVGANC